MKRILLIIAFLLYALPVFADCIELPIINHATRRGQPGDYDPAIPPTAGLPNDYVTDGIPTVGGKPKFSTVITCFRDSVVISPRLSPMTRDQAAMIIHNRDPGVRFNPDSLKLPERRGFIQGLLDRAWQTAVRYIEPALAWATTSTDNFDRADNADLTDGSHGWDPYDNPTSSPCQILNNSATNTTNTIDCVEGYSTYIPGANQYVQLSLPLGFVRDDFFFVSAIVRLQAPSTYSGYVCRAQPPSQTNTSRIRRADAGSLSTLLNDTTVTWAVGDVLRCEITGYVITFKRNGVTVFSKDDPGTTYATGRGGINILDGPADPGNPIDDFEVGDLAGGAVTVRHRPLVLQ